MKKVMIAIAMSALINAPAAMAQTVHAVASFTVLADIVKNVGGEHVVVKSLVGANGDPHSFEPTPKDSQALAQADVVFVSGLGMEGWMDRLIAASGYKGEIVVASSGIETMKMEEDGKTIADPHAWNSMHNGVIYATNVMNALIAADAQDADYFRRHGSAYIERLKQLDSWAQQAFSAIPQNKRKVLTSHDAFGYFGQRYGVKFLSPVGFSTESEASASEVAALISQLKREHIHAWFIENQTDPRLVKQIAASSGAKAGGELYPEALTVKGGEADSYIGAFQHNVKAMVASMQ
ncbi:metal ABC transporter substrate-binding protein [Erwinia tasmaniensis]|uniref:ABC transporter substrate-binding protein n=1 Tax=Erwinia tasmaniensis (strain DSM 17950 / CFBP 7177 / CIP 109463 / NCPPB 4357 / Et1/99) TaxID=465817 RepID=B2VHV9_ERWT9|nr:metal ABC transporter substrate-binding protein [Erwinia tasmaniensis]CAO97530.1 ABC transporter substrate-binding protein [Erwinia tasmaniensis Et1/99]